MLYKDGKKVWDLLVPMPVGSTNNEAEFETLVQGLKKLRDTGQTGDVIVRGDSMIVLNTVKGQLDATNSHLKQHWDAARRLVRELSAAGCNLTLEHVLRDRNIDADALSNIEMDRKTAELKRVGFSTELDTWKEQNGKAQAKSNKMAQLIRSLEKIAATAITPGHDIRTTILMAIGGQETRGLSVRPQFSKETLDVIRKLELHNAKLKRARLDAAIAGIADVTKKQHMCEWAGTFQVRDHYPPGWDAYSAREKKRWKQTALDDEDNKLCFRVTREDASLAPPENATLKAPNQRICWSHHKGLCGSCTAQKQPLVTCCSLHHDNNPDLPELWDFCKTHKLTQCGACLLDRVPTETCCKKHHDHE